MRTVDEIAYWMSTRETWLNFQGYGGTENWIGKWGKNNYWRKEAIDLKDLGSWERGNRNKTEDCSSWKSKRISSSWAEKWKK